MALAAGKWRWLALGGGKMALLYPELGSQQLDQLAGVDLIVKRELIDRDLGGLGIKHVLSVHLPVDVCSTCG